MKRIKYFLGAIVLLGFNSCGEDYLETEPQAEVNTLSTVESVVNADHAINGICRLMTHQYLGSQGFNGEGPIKTWYGNYPGNDWSADLPDYRRHRQQVQIPPYHQLLDWRQHPAERSADI